MPLSDRPHCPECNATERTTPTDSLSLCSGLGQSDVGLHVLEYDADPARVVWICSECGCTFSRAAGRVSMVTACLGADDAPVSHMIARPKR